MRNLTPSLSLASVITVMATTPVLSLAEALSGDAWQYNLLFAPSAAQIEIEKRGRVMIYDGLRDVDIDRAMVEQFHRVQSMMFVRTVVTDEGGSPETDQETGIPVIEDDGCD